MAKIVPIALLLFPLTCLAQVPACTNPPTKPVASGKISASGCVVSGVEPGCYMLRDRQTGTLFHLMFKNTPPSFGTGVSVTGEPYNGMTTCMQGKAITVKTCEPIHLDCKETGMLPPVKPMEKDASEAAKSGTSTADPDFVKRSCKDWKATYLRMEAGRGTLTVNGTCNVRADIKLSLRPRVPPGFNPSDYLFDLRMTTPPGIHPQVQMDKPVRYQERTAKSYDTVTVPNSPSTKVEIVKH